MSFFGNLIGGPLRDKLDDAQKAAPALVDKTLASTGLAISGSVAKASELFTRIYTSATAGIAAWLPTTKPWVLAKVAQGIAWAKVQAGKL